MSTTSAITVRFTPEQIAEAAGKRDKSGKVLYPTAQQSAVISAPAGPMLVVAGAGAGKTETMANRVVWLVANGFAKPEEVLGITFTRKAAQELGLRIRQRLSALAQSRLIQDLPKDDPLRKNLAVIAPKAATYDAYAGEILRQYGLLLPIETGATILADTDRWMLAYDLVRDWPTDIPHAGQLNSVVGDVIKLSDEIDAALVTTDDVREESNSFVENITGLEFNKDGVHSKLRPCVNCHEKRMAYLDIVDALNEELAKNNYLTFSKQMAAAARLAQHSPLVGAQERGRFKVIMMDEYQDTSTAQRILLRSLYGDGQGQTTDENSSQPLTVTAVGDPMQAIYGWRGATAENLEFFRQDFPLGDGNSAPKMELTTSWRNPPEVLELANIISDAAFERAAATRSVSALEPRPGFAAADGVKMAMFDYSQGDNGEIAWIADQMAAEYFAHQEEQAEAERPKPFTGAVLIRKNAQVAPIAEALITRGIPVEVGLSGLLDIPEIIDVLAVLKVLTNPASDADMMRILTGARWRLGLKDINALRTRARQLTKAAANADAKAEDTTSAPSLAAETSDSADLSVDKQFEQGLEKITITGEAEASLADAVADPGEPEQYSEAGWQRISELSAELRHLRRYSLAKALPELVSDIERVLGIRVEAGARETAQTLISAGTSHLDEFQKVVEELAARGHATVSKLLAYLELAREHADGLDAGETVVKGDRVQIMTVHRSKGLEWDVVAVPHVCDSVYPSSDTSKVGGKLDFWPSQAQVVPAGLREEQPDIELDECVTQGDAVKMVEAHRDDMWDRTSQESDRLLYVALTRSAKKLYISATHYLADTQTVRKEAGLLAIAHAHYHQDEARRDQVIVRWDAQPEEYDATRTAAAPAVFPTDPLGERRADVDTGADLVRQAMAGQLSVGTDGELAGLWQRDVTALIDEHQRAKTTAVVVDLPSSLTTSDVVAMQKDRKQFARRLRRPVPFEPNRFARRGTAFHNELEKRFGAASLLDPDMLPGANDADLTDATLAQLMARFDASVWGNRVPKHVEQAFSIVIGGRTLEGRIDAIFQIDGQWWVVDWKTGRQPTGRDLHDASFQLAVYRIAWARQLQAQGYDVQPENVRAAFHYVVENKTVEPDDLAGEVELAQYLAATDAADNANS
ncbi:UvrD-helicase domain-containing protein [Corynebacterium ulceribovis]|uniref:UvrD-helicase domain-containing protein n=1 Tax=Corynebacterium ulceribovis TaxID=487732 RepID=UPI0003697BBC|nr:UvrD-helicase domain-containing protein [Corynebacterium ulceribovis]